jgi:hypothetical protein
MFSILASHHRQNFFLPSEEGKRDRKREKVRLLVLADDEKTSSYEMHPLSKVRETVVHRPLCLNYFIPTF